MACPDFVLSVCANNSTCFHEKFLILCKFLYRVQQEHHLHSLFGFSELENQGLAYSAFFRAVRKESCRLGLVVVCSVRGAHDS